MDHSQKEQLTSNISKIDKKLAKLREDMTLDKHLKLVLAEKLKKQKKGLNRKINKGQIKGMVKKTQMDMVEVMSHVNFYILIYGNQIYQQLVQSIFVLGSFTNIFSNLCNHL